MFLGETDDGGEADVPEELINLAQHALNLTAWRPVISGGLELLVMPRHVYAAAITTAPISMARWCGMVNLNE